MTDVKLQLHRNKIKRNTKQSIKYFIIILSAFIMLYPLIWVIGASFNDGPKASFGFWPETFTLQGWRGAFRAPGWGRDAQGRPLLLALWNTLQYVIPYTIFQTITCLFTAYVVTRMNFKGKKIVFTLIILTLLMPATIFRIPMYVFFTSDFMRPLWVNSSVPFMPYFPLWAGGLFAVNSFSIFMYIQFFRTIPRDLDEAAYMDGANKFQVLFYVLMPILKPIVITVALLLFISSYNDYQGPLIYQGADHTKPLSLVLPMLSVDSVNTYAHVYARSIISVALLVIIFFAAQRYFIGNDADSAIKG